MTKRIEAIPVDNSSVLFKDMCFVRLKPRKKEHHAMVCHQDEAVVKVSTWRRAKRRRGGTQQRRNEHPF